MPQRKRRKIALQTHRQPSGATKIRRRSNPTPNTKFQSYKRYFKVTNDDNSSHCKITKLQHIAKSESDCGDSSEKVTREGLNLILLELGLEVLNQTVEYADFIGKFGNLLNIVGNTLTCFLSGCRIFFAQSRKILDRVEQ